MEWRFGVTRIRQPDVRGQYGRYHSAAVAEARTSRRRSEWTRRVNDPAELAHTLGYAWDDWAPGQTRTARLVRAEARKAALPLLWPEGQQFDGILKACLEDIGRVLDPGDDRALTPREALRPGVWPLKEGHVDLYLLDPSLGTVVRPEGYTRLVIVLHVGLAQNRETGREERYNHVYEWTLEYCDPNRFKFDSPLSEFDIDRIHQVSKAVFLLHSLRGATGVLKLEPADPRRYAPILTFFRYLFESTPASAEMTQPDLGAVTSLHPSRQKKLSEEYDYPVSEIKKLFATTPMSARRMSFTHLTKNLGRLIDDAYLKPEHERREAFETIHDQVFLTAQFERFGKLAAADSLVGNNDRLAGNYDLDANTRLFRRDKQGKLKRIFKFFNVDNVDFDRSGCAVAVDNIDPNSYLVKGEGAITWPAYAYLETLNARTTFATDMVEAFADLTAYRRPGANLVRPKPQDVVYMFDDQARLEDCKVAFLKGLQGGIADMKAIRDEYERFGKIKGWGPVSDEIWRRIGMLA